MRRWIPAFAGMANAASCLEQKMPKNVIEVNNLSKSFDDVVAVDNISFE